MHFHNSCTRNGDHLIPLINTGIAHKERTMPQTIINTFKKCGGEGSIHRQNDGCFHNDRIKLYSCKPIFRFGAIPCLLIILVLSSLAGTFAFFPA